MCGMPNMAVDRTFFPSCSVKKQTRTHGHFDNLNCTDWAGLNHRFPVVAHHYFGKPSMAVVGKIDLLA